MNNSRRLNQVIAIRILDGRRVQLTFDDELEREIDLTPLIDGKGWEDIRDQDDVFHAVHVEYGTLVWPGDRALDANVLHGDYLPARITHPSLEEAIDVEWPEKVSEEEWERRLWEDYWSRHPEQRSQAQR